MKTLKPEDFEVNVASIHRDGNSIIFGLFANSNVAGIITNIRLWLENIPFSSINFQETNREIVVRLPSKSEREELIKKIELFLEMKI